MKAKIKDNLIERYEKVMPDELEATKDAHEVVAFLKFIEDREVELVFTHGDAFEKHDDNIWLPDELWDEIFF